ncbi:hypothetical protein K491DRAFT_681580 [Lophiostoma macrostomum CBS 122681]|uniref:Uncharacterized protein n=1 Tax=Lophiostoma macrostomum CBS 122681 TaxID=1314788 RepID=A0A6A6SX82_9PLEO|nr:hypothetical protein K491DRAFT_681580 [Lophiostoma macrostomum CBS 122681]
MIHLIVKTTALERSVPLDDCPFPPHIPTPAQFAGKPWYKIYSASRRPADTNPGINHLSRDRQETRYIQMRCVPVQKLGSTWTGRDEMHVLVETSSSDLQMPGIDFMGWSDDPGVANDEVKRLQSWRSWKSWKGLVGGGEDGTRVSVELVDVVV